MTPNDATLDPPPITTPVGPGMSFEDLHDAAEEWDGYGCEVEAAQGKAAALPAFRRALEYFEAAAGRFAPRAENEPARSLAYLRAASIAFTCGEDGAASRLVRTAVEGDVPAEVRAEIREMLGGNWMPMLRRIVGWEPPPWTG